MVLLVSVHVTVHRLPVVVYIIACIGRSIFTQMSH